MLLGLVGNNKPVITGPTWEADSSVEHGNAPELITFTSRYNLLNVLNKIQKCRLLKLQFKLCIYKC